MADLRTVGIGRTTTLALAALLLVGASGNGQEVARGDSATVAATGHGRLELDVTHDGTSDGTGHGGVRVALDAQIAARMGIAAGAATIALIVGAGGMATRRQRARRDAVD